MFFEFDYDILHSGDDVFVLGGDVGNVGNDLHDFHQLVVVDWLSIFGFLWDVFDSLLGLLDEVVQVEESLFELEFQEFGVDVNPLFHSAVQVVLQWSEVEFQPDDVQRTWDLLDFLLDVLQLGDLVIEEV